MRYTSVLYVTLTFRFQPRLLKYWVRHAWRPLYGHGVEKVSRSIFICVAYLLAKLSLRTYLFTYVVLVVLSPNPFIIVIYAPSIFFYLTQLQHKPRPLCTSYLPHPPHLDQL